jgi:hypothetical protein
MLAGLTATSRIATSDLNTLPTTTTTQVLALPTLDVSMTGALVTGVTTQIGHVGHTHDHDRVQESAITSDIVINIHRTEMATVIEAEATSDEASTAIIDRHARLIILTGNLETFKSRIHKTRVGEAVLWRKMTTSLVEGKISTGMGISRAITNDLKHLRRPEHGIR